ncbi:MAG: BrnT family toxin, partial [Nitrospirae bacterium]|nr:BrnT family toxin [Nitrospirota bacterium]
LIAVQDAQHSQKEPRYFALGCTDAGRHLFIVFTIRENLIRVISARDMNRKERRLYETS